MKKLVFLCCLIISVPAIAKKMSADLPGSIKGEVLVLKMKHLGPDHELQPAIALDEEYVFSDGVRTKLMAVLIRDESLHDKLLKSEGRKVRVNCSEFFTYYESENGRSATKKLCIANQVMFKDN